ncbi:hypothetical protein XENORESO_017230 [Xenotaenia resolanae]|uniref:Uncharacterized protein n=1 Tax=Xenotaenia resolanae TaxID=208358 RepID=A0ABV0WF37_9TELE
MGTTQQPQCRSPRELEQIQQLTMRPKGTPPLSRGPTEPGGPGPTKQPPRMSRHTPGQSKVHKKYKVHRHKIHREIQTISCRKNSGKLSHYNHVNIFDPAS